MTEEKRYCKNAKTWGKPNVYDKLSHKSLDVDDVINRMNNYWWAIRKLMEKNKELKSNEKNTEEYNLKEIHEILIDAHKNFLRYQGNMSFSDHLILDKLFESIYQKFGILEKKWNY